jgi:hypothetical protein
MTVVQEQTLRQALTGFFLKKNIYFSGADTAPGPYRRRYAGQGKDRHGENPRVFDTFYSAGCGRQGKGF